MGSPAFGVWNIGYGREEVIACRYGADAESGVLPFIFQ